MRILLTGATGFLGSNLLIKLLRDGHELFCIKRELSNTSRIDDVKDLCTWFDIETTKFNDIFLNNNIKCVVHCATDYGAAEQDPIKTIQANLILPLELLNVAIKNNVYAFINTDTVLDKRINAYSLSKKQFVEWLDRCSEEIVAINLALEHFFGPRDNESKFVSYMINELLDNRVNSAIKLTPGMQRRNFIYIDDVTNAFSTLINNLEKFGNSFHNFNIGTEHTVTIKEFSKLVKELCGNKNTYLDFGAIPYRKNETMEPAISNVKILKDFGWSVNTTLEEGLIKTINYNKNKDLLT
jgi:CDP-paratose synthetase